MRRMQFIGVGVSLALLALVAGQAVAQPAFVSGSARVEYAEKETKAPKALEALKLAVAEMRKNLGDRKPKCYIISENLTAPEAVSAELPKLLADAPYAGMANNWDEYLPVDARSLGSAIKAKNGIVIIAVCGDVETELQMVDGLTYKEVSYNQPATAQTDEWLLQKPAHVAKGEELVKKFKFPTTPGITNVLMVCGTMHTPRQEFIFEGVRKGLPEGVKLIGGSGSNFADIYFNGKDVKGGALFGLRISGKFQALATGSKGGKNAHLGLEEHFKLLTGQMGAIKPTAAIYFGCAGWNNNLDGQQVVLEKYLPAGVGVFGQYCGGEFGKMKDKEELQVGTGMGVVVLMGPPAAESK